MSIPWERAVGEDFNLGYGDVSVSMPGGGSATGSKVGIHTFLPRVFNVIDHGALCDDATDCGPAIQDAHDALPSTGGVIYFPPSASGQKYAVATKVTLTKPCCVMGGGWNSIIRANGAITAIFEFQSGSDGSVVQDLRIEGNKAASGGTIQRGVYINGAKYITIQRNRFSGPSANVGLNFGVDVLGDNSGYARILSNRFERGVSSSGNGTAILLEYTSYVHVIGNVIDGSTLYNADSGVSAAILLSQEAGGNGCQYCLLQNNKIHDWPQVGIDVGSTTYFEFSANLGQNYRNVIDGNEISGCNAASGGVASSAIYIVSNAAFNRVSNNIVYNNGHATAGGYGIVLEGTQEGTAEAGQPKLDETPNYNEVVGNRVFQNKDHGIRVNGATNTLIKDNFCYENGQRTAATFDNINIVRVGGDSSGNNNIVTGNVCVGSQPANQIHIGANATGTYLGPNVTPTAATTAILDEGTSTQRAMLQMADGAFRIGGQFWVPDGVSAPSATVGVAKIFVDSADGDLKVIYGDGTTKVIVADT